MYVLHLVLLLAIPLLGGIFSGWRAGYTLGSFTQHIWHFGLERYPIRAKKRAVRGCLNCLDNMYLLKSIKQNTFDNTSLDQSL